METAVHLVLIIQSFPSPSQPRYHFHYVSKNSAFVAQNVTRNLFTLKRKSIAIQEDYLVYRKLILAKVMSYFFCNKRATDLLVLFSFRALLILLSDTMYYHSIFRTGILSQSVIPHQVLGYWLGTRQSGNCYITHKRAQSTLGTWVCIFKMFSLSSVLLINGKSFGTHIPLCCYLNIYLP